MDLRPPEKIWGSRVFYNQLKFRELIYLINAAITSAIKAIISKKRKFYV
jgi:hypothetical protein